MRHIKHGVTTVTRQCGSLTLARHYTSVPDPVAVPIALKPLEAKPTPPSTSRSVPEPPSSTRKYVRNKTFTAPAPPPQQSTTRYQAPQPQELPSYRPTKENLQELLKDLQDNVEQYKVHSLLTKFYLLEPAQAQSIFDLAKSKNIVNAKTHSILISYYARKGDLDTAKKALQEAEDAKAEIDNATIIFLLEAAILKNDISFAEAMYRRVNRKREIAFPAYRHLLRHYFFASRLNEFDATFMEMINNQIKIPAYDPEARNFVIWMVRVLHQLGRSAAIAQLYRAVRKTPIVLPHDMYINVIRSMGNEESSEIKLLIDDMKRKGVEFDSKIYYPLLRALGRHDPEFAKQIGDEMMKSTLPMDMRTYNAYLHVCVRHRTPAATHDALRTFERIKSVGLKPDILTYANLIKACGQVGDIATCDTLLHELTSSGITLTQEALTNVLSVVPSEVAFKILKALKGAGVTVDVIAYNMMLKRTDAETAQQVLQMMEDEKIERDAVTYNTLMGVYGKSRNTLKCKELLQEMDAKGITTDVWAYNAMIPALALEQPADALDWLREVRAKGCQPDEVTYNSLFTNLLRKTKKSFVPLWQDMMQHEVRASVYSYNLYIKARGQAGEVDACEPLLREMRANELAPDVVSYTTCFDFITDIPTLRRLFTEMLAQEIAPGVPSYVSLLRQCARSGDSAWAQELISDANKRGLVSANAAQELKKLMQGTDGFMQMPEKLLEMYNNGNIK